MVRNINSKLLNELVGDYKQLIFKEKVKKTFYSIGEISAQLILIAGVLAGGVVIATIAPNVLAVLGKMGKRKKERVYFNCRQGQFNRALVYLKNRQYINIRNTEEGIGINLSDKGKRRCNLLLLDKIKIKEPKRWDGRWRIVIFDIPEKLKIAREALREKLRHLDFFQLQKSVFIIPYPCEKEINFIKEIFGVGQHARLVLAERFQGEEEVKKHFGISK